jgi:hypothetical protein
MCFQPTSTDPSGGWDGKLQEEEERMRFFDNAPTPARGGRAANGVKGALLRALLLKAK